MHQLWLLNATGYPNIFLSIDAEFEILKQGQSQHQFASANM